MKVRNWISISVSAVVGVSLLIFLFSQTVQTQSQNAEFNATPRAAIIDQLHDEITNVKFQTTVKNNLEAAGYRVDVYVTKQITVDFYKKLPEMGYKFIVIRTHGAAKGNEQNSVALFTGEKYRDDQYVLEQMSNQVMKGSTERSVTFDVSIGQAVASTEGDVKEYVTAPVVDVKEADPYFVIGSKFVDELMIGKFPGTVIIVGGCDILSNPSLADSLLRRGASAIIGWDESIGSYQNDFTMLKLLEDMLVHRVEIKEAVKSAMEDYQWNFQDSLPVALKYYPNSAGNVQVNETSQPNT